jgi:hypothetical protein
MFVVDWARWEKPPAADDTPKGGEQVPGPVQSIPRNLRAPEVPESEDSEPKMERVTEMMSRGSGRAVQSIPRNLWDPPMTRMMSWESGRAGIPKQPQLNSGIPKQPQLDSGAGEAAGD